jgi:hypothetical protein
MSRKKQSLARPMFRHITLDAFKTTYNDVAVKYPDLGDLSQIIANTTVVHFLGGEWLNKYVHHTSRHAKYLCVDINAALPERARAMMRYWEFAETLFNLQYVEGFEAVLDELAHGKIESACGEIDVARMLNFHGLEFRFVSPSRGAKLNYDFEIFYPDGFRVCAEAAAKFEATVPRAKSIRDSLRHSRDQLPDDEPSVILVKVPEKWITDVILAGQIVDVALDYLRQSTHVTSVKFDAPITISTAQATARWHAYYEVSNPQFPDRNWDMFRDETVPINGCPPWWLRFHPELKMPE